MPITDQANTFESYASLIPLGAINGFIYSPLVYKNVKNYIHINHLANNLFVCNYSNTHVTIYRHRYNTFLINVTHFIFI